MKAPAAALDLIRRFEGLHKLRHDGRVEAYADPAHGWQVPTIGWGSTGPDVQRGTVWSREACVARLERDASRFASGVSAASPVVAGDAPRLSALTSFAFNLGLGAYQGSTLRRKVGERDWPEAGRQCRRWTRGGGRVLPGLVLRREAEALLLEGGGR